MTDTTLPLTAALRAAIVAALTGSGFASPRVTQTPQEGEAVPFTALVMPTLAPSFKVGTFENGCSSHVVTFTTWSNSPTAATQMGAAIVNALTAGDRQGTPLAVSGARVDHVALENAFSTSDTRATGTVHGRVHLVRFDLTPTS